MSFNIRLDIDPVLICPYDKNHKIARSRIQRHLVKCERNFPPDYKQQCPYDATHRVFEHEMVKHVETCPMKFMTSRNTYSDIKLPELNPEEESKIENDEIWDDSTEPATNIKFNDPMFVKHSTTTTITFQNVRGNALIAKRFNTKLRRPFGYSESMMLDVSNQSIDEDTQSVTSDMGIGRGQIILRSVRGSYVRGIGGSSYRRGFRGRLLH